MKERFSRRRQCIRPQKLTSMGHSLYHSLYMSDSIEIRQKPPCLLGSVCYCLYGSPESCPCILNRGSESAPIITHGYVRLSGREIFRTRPDLPWGPPSLLYNGHQVIPGNKEAGHGVEHPSHLAPRLRKEYSYTFTPSLCLRGLL